MTFYLRSGLLLGAASACLLHAAAPAFAADEDRIETVVVTAERRAENVQDVPIAVTPLSADQLNHDNAENLGALQGQVPNLNIAQGRGSNSSANIFIRGVGQPDALWSFDPGVGLYVNDVYMSRIQGALVDTFDVANVEVLNGPQGTLYGKNAIAGAIKIQTFEPTDDFQGAAQADYGSYNDREVRARVSGPLVDGLDYSAMGYFAQRDGYIQDPILGRHYDNKNTWALRGGLSWAPSDRLKFTLDVDDTNEDPELSVGKTENVLYSTDLGVAIFGNAPPPAPQFPIVTVLSVPTPGPYDYKTATGANLPNNDNYLHHAGIALTASYELTDTLTLKSISAVRNLAYQSYEDIDATPFEVGDVFFRFNQHQYSQELQLIYTGENLRAIAGLFFLREELPSTQAAFANDLYTFFGSPISPLTRNIHDDLNTESYAAFASVDYDFAPGWTISGGLRGTIENKDYHYATTFTTSAAYQPLFSALDFSYAGSHHWSDLSPSGTLRYEISKDAMVYAKISKGFKSGGFNGRPDNAAEEIPYKPETLLSYEAGAKSSWFDGRLIVNGDIFYNDYRDFQARTSEGSGLAADFAVINAAKLQQYGAELEITGRPTDALQLDTEIGLLHANYENFIDDQFTPANNPANDRSWQKPAFSPALTARVGGQYTFDLGSDGGLDLFGDWNYRSRTALAVDNADYFTHVPYPGMFQGAYWTMDARLEWHDVDGRYKLAVFGRNLTDKVYAVDAQEFSAVGGIRTTYFSEPRTFGIEAGIKF